MNFSHTRARPMEFHQLLSISSRTVNVHVLHHVNLMMAPPKKMPDRSHGYNPHTEYQYPLLTTRIPVNPIATSG